MGEIAEMMLDGTMDPETGEFNFDGEDGPGFPMTGVEAAAWRRAGLGPKRPRHQKRRDPDRPRAEPIYRMTKTWRAKLEVFGEVRNNDAYNWQIRRDGKVIADFWPHKNKWRLAGEAMQWATIDKLHAALKKHCG